LRPNGAIWATVTGQGAASFNIKGTDGVITDFYKDGSPVGSIGTNGGDLTVGTGDTGLAFLDGGNFIAPWNTSTNAIRDAAVDLGTTSGRFKDLYLSGTINASSGDISASQANFVITSSNTAAGNEAKLLLSHAGNNSFEIKGGSDLIFSSDGGTNERARITTAGNLLVGTTTGTIGTANFGTSISADGRILSSGNRGATVSAHIFYGNAGQAIIKGDGDLENTNNSYGAVSDIKLKENITDATPKLSGLLDVRVVNYNLIAQPDVKQIGVIAQELEIIFPALVKESPDLDDDGEDLGTTTKSVKYSVFVPMLIKAIQEQQTLIESLTTRIAALETGE